MSENPPLPVSASLAVFLPRLIRLRDEEGWAQSRQRKWETRRGGEAGHCKKCEVNNRTIEILVGRSLHVTKPTNGCDAFQINHFKECIAQML